jgi:hypothetical protein
MLGGFGVLAAIQAADPNEPGIRPGEADQHVDGRGFAGPIWPEKTEQLPWVNLEGDTVNRGDLAESLR